MLRIVVYILLSRNRTSCHHTCSCISLLHRRLAFCKSDLRPRPFPRICTPSQSLLITFPRSNLCTRLHLTQSSRLAPGRIAIETAGIVLIRNNLRDVVTAIRLSKATVRKIKKYLFWAFCYNVVLPPIAAGALFLGARLMTSCLTLRVRHGNLHC